MPFKHRVAGSSPARLTKNNSRIHTRATERAAGTAPPTQPPPISALRPRLSCVKLVSMKYHEVLPMSRAELDVSLHSGNVEAICGALLSAAYFDPVWRWVEQQCLSFLDHTDNSVRWVAATCLGHLARLHGQLDLEVVLNRLVPLKSDPEIGPGVEDALDDIKFFLRFQ